MREFREIRLDLGADGTGDAAAPYISAARVQLGVLKNRMALGGLLQGALNRVLPDGTIIRVESSFGRDTVRIAASPVIPGVIPPSTPITEAPAALPPEVTLPELPTPLIAVGGGLWYDSNNGQSGYAYLWHSPHSFTGLGSLSGSWNNFAAGVSLNAQTIGVYTSDNTPTMAAILNHGNLFDAGRIQGSTYNYATAVSDKGRVVVSSSTSYAGYWSSATGLVDLGAPIRAYGISGDGNVLVGVSHTGATAATYNIATGTLTMIPGLSSNSAATAASHDGAVVVGYQQNIDGTYYAWRYSAANGLQTLSPASGDYYAAWDVTDDGKIVTICQGAMKVLFGASYSNVVSWATEAYWWSAQTGLVHLGSGIPTCITGDGETIGGSTGGLGDYNGDQPQIWDRVSRKATLYHVGGSAVGGIIYGLTNRA